MTTKYYDSPRWSGEILDCAMPMTFDTYSRCAYNCLYCFGIYQKLTNKTVGKKGKAITLQPVHNVNVKKVINIFEMESKSQFSSYILAEKVMQWGGMTDPFDEYERKHGITLELLKYFKKRNYPLRFSTKATWWTKDKRYTDLIRGQKNWVFMISIINWEPGLAKKIEKGVDSPQERVKALGRIADLDCAGSILRLRPFILGMTDLNNGHIKLINAAAKAGATGVSTEFFCLERRAGEDLKERYNKMSTALGFNIVEQYKRLSKGSGYLRLNRNVKEPYVLEMKQAAEANGMRFSVSDAHHKEKGCSGGCCALPDSMNVQKGQFTEALMIAKEKGRVTFADLVATGDLEKFKEFLYRSAQGFNTQSQVNRVKRTEQTMYEYIRQSWNTPKQANSPYRYFDGVLVPVGLDDNKDVIYEYDYEKAGTGGQE
jgi:DNA repair photolyase